VPATYVLKSAIQTLIKNKKHRILLQNIWIDRVIYQVFGRKKFASCKTFRKDLVAIYIFA